jgi:hypothetical protein
MRLLLLLFALGCASRAAKAPPRRAEPEQPECWRVDVICRVSKAASDGAQWTSEVDCAGTDGEFSGVPLSGWWVATPNLALSYHSDFKDREVLRVQWPLERFDERIHEEEDESIDVMFAPCEDVVDEALLAKLGCAGLWCAREYEDIDGSRVRDVACFGPEGVQAAYRWNRFTEADVTITWAKRVSPPAAHDEGPLPPIFRELVTEGTELRFDVERCFYPEEDE